MKAAERYTLYFDLPATLDSFLFQPKLILSKNSFTNKEPLAAYQIVELSKDLVLLQENFLLRIIDMISNKPKIEVSLVSYFALSMTPKMQRFQEMIIILTKDVLLLYDMSRYAVCYNVKIETNLLKEGSRFTVFSNPFIAYSSLMYQVIENESSTFFVYYFQTGSSQ